MIKRRRHSLNYVVKLNSCIRKLMRKKKKKITRLIENAQKKKILILNQKEVFHTNLYNYFLNATTIVNSVAFQNIFSYLILNECRTIFNFSFSQFNLKKIFFFHFISGI